MFYGPPGKYQLSQEMKSLYPEIKKEIEVAFKNTKDISAAKTVAAKKIGIGIKTLYNIIHDVEKELDKQD